jgi:hypothetical protein
MQNARKYGHFPAIPPFLCTFLSIKRQRLDLPACTRYPSPEAALYTVPVQLATADRAFNNPVLQPLRQDYKKDNIEWSINE